jgi:hypothetical protein
MFLIFTGHARAFCANFLKIYKFAPLVNSLRNLSRTAQNIKNN